MLSHDIFKALFLKELKSLGTVKALWIMLIILSLLTGFSFVQAVNLFSQASRTALQYPEMARGMVPLAGVFIPTLGALYLITTLLFPFVAIRVLSSEKQNGSLKLLFQSPLSIVNIVSVKFTALGFGWLLALFPAVSAIAVWHFLGGHVHLLSVINLFLGYTLYAVVIAGISFLSASLTKSTATAAILTISFTLGSWVLDFASGTQGWMQHLSFLSLTTFLKEFEHGLFSLASVMQTAITAAGFFALSVVFLNTGKTIRTKLMQTLLITVSCVLLWVPSSGVRVYSDTTESRANSFNPAEERSLGQMNEELTITIHLSQEDSRLHDYRQNILSKLQRTVPRLTTVYVSGNTLYDTTNDDKYGLIEYDYNGNHDESWSNSPGEVLPILHSLSGVTVVPDTLPEYTGYPLVASADSYRLWFYGVLPALFSVLWWMSCKSPGKRKGNRYDNRKNG